MLSHASHGSSLLEAWLKCNCNLWRICNVCLPQILKLPTFREIIFSCRGYYRQWLSWDTTSFISVVGLACKLFLWNYCLYWQQFEQKSFVVPWLVREDDSGLAPSGAHSKNHDISLEETPNECRYAATRWKSVTLNKRSTKELLPTVSGIFALWKPFSRPNDPSESYLSLSWKKRHACTCCILWMELGLFRRATQFALMFTFMHGTMLGMNSLSFWFWNPLKAHSAMTTIKWPTCLSHCCGRRKITLSQ
jgi:hypothetical protein